MTSREEALQKIKGRAVLVSISGGKDSTATFLHVHRELGIPVQLVHMDTGWENLQTVEYLQRLPELLGHPITILRDEVPLSDELREIAEDLEKRYMDGHYSAMIRRCLLKAMFSSRLKRWCTQKLKIHPFINHAFSTYGKDSNGIGQFVNCVGVRAQESVKRAGLPEWQMDDAGFVIWRPIIDWDESQVIAIHKKHGIKPNPLYLRGAKRVGCWPCINSRKAEIRQCAESDPVRIDLIRELETIVTTFAKQRALAKGNEFIRAADGAEKFRAFFSNPNYRKELKRLRAEAPADTDPAEYAKVRARQQAPIDEVITWSRTNRKGEPEPFAPLPHETGCTRWGFCDLSWREEQPAQQDLFRGNNEDQ